MSKFIFLKSLRELLIPLKRLIDRKAENVDWNENDPSSTSYIANRPFYKEEKEADFIPLMDVEFSDYWNVTPLPFFNLTRGEIYTVIFDGKEYKCKAVDDGFGGEALGNFYVVGAGADTGEPFFIYEEENGVWRGMAIPAETATCTLQIFGKQSIVHKVPTEYLGLPKIPTMLSELESDEWNNTVSIQQIKNWNNKSYDNLTNKPKIPSWTQDLSLNNLITPVAAPLTDNYTSGGRTYYYCGTMSKVLTNDGKNFHILIGFGDKEGNICETDVKVSGYASKDGEIIYYSVSCGVIYNDNGQDIKCSFLMYTDTGKVYICTYPKTYTINTDGTTVNNILIKGIYEYEEPYITTEELSTTVPVIKTASVGQTIVVKSVDENGKPIEWETMDINEKALPLTGGTLSGDLYANGFYVNSPSIYPSVTFSGTVDEELEKFGMVEFHENHRGSIVSEMQDGSYKEYYQFPRPADTGTENVYYDVLTTKNPSESLAKLGGLPLTGGTLSGDLKLTSGTNQRKINIYRNIGDSQYELQHSINYEGKGFLGVYKNSKEVNMIKLGENSTEFSKPITVSGGATGDVAARTRENLGITDGIPVPTTATVGQTVVVKAVDENGKPTEWEAKDIVTETEINSLMTALKSDIPTDEHINELISTALASFTNAEEVSY